MRRIVSGLASVAGIAALGLCAAYAADPVAPSEPPAASDAATAPGVYYAPAPNQRETLRAEDFPIGVTVLGRTADSIPQQRVRISVEPVPSSPPTPLPNLPPISLEGVVVRPVEISAPPAPVDEFTRALARARRAEFLARTTVSQDKGQWSPTPAYPEGDPTKPYPWNPATFSTPIWSQNWSTQSTWPPGQDLRSWSPVRWTAPPFDPVWLPTDAWDRDLKLEPTP